MLALDPGNRETGWCIVDTITRAPVQGGKDENTFVSGSVSGGAFSVAAIEIIESYGMAVGREPGGWGSPTGGARAPVAVGNAACEFLTQRGTKSF